MKRNQTLLIGTLIFYIIAGLFAGLFFLRNGSLLSEKLIPKNTVISPGIVGSIDTDRQDPVPATPTLAPEATPEPKPTPEPEEPKQAYYKFTVITVMQPLNVRLEPSMTAQIISNLSRGTTGYILQLGDEWSLITSGEITGYCSNQYLQLEEIPVEEFPAEYLVP